MLSLIGHRAVHLLLFMAIIVAANATPSASAAVSSCDESCSYELPGCYLYTECNPHMYECEPKNSECASCIYTSVCGPTSKCTSPWPLAIECIANPTP